MKTIVSDWGHFASLACAVFALSGAGCRDGNASVHTTEAHDAAPTLPRSSSMSTPSNGSGFMPNLPAVRVRRRPCGCPAPSTTTSTTTPRWDLAGRAGFTVKVTLGDHVKKGQVLATLVVPSIAERAGRFPHRVSRRQRRSKNLDREDGDIAARSTDHCSRSRSRAQAKLRRPKRSWPPVSAKMRALSRRRAA